MIDDGRWGAARIPAAHVAAASSACPTRQNGSASSTGGKGDARLADSRRSSQSVDAIGFRESAGPPSGKSIWQFAGGIAKIGTVDATRTALGGISAAARSTNGDSHLGDLAFDDGSQVDGSLPSHQKLWESSQNDDGHPELRRFCGRAVRPRVDWSLGVVVQDVVEKPF
jgi:hypothetical protein